MLASRPAAWFAGKGESFGGLSSGAANGSILSQSDPRRNFCCFRLRYRQQKGAFMADAIVTPIGWERALMAAEKVKERLRRAAEARRYTVVPAALPSIHPPCSACVAGDDHRA